jgi:hypothetical protein
MMCCFAAGLGLASAAAAQAAPATVNAQMEMLVREAPSRRGVGLRGPKDGDGEG